jgi:hypothetical protein
MYRDRYSYHDDQPKVVMIENDELGEARFTKLKEEFKNVKLTPEMQRRYDNIVTVFSYRLDLSKQAKFPRQFQGAAQRLEKFKSVAFFMDAFQALLDESKKAAADELERKRTQRKARESKPRSWGW